MPKSPKKWGERDSSQVELVCWLVTAWAAFAVVSLGWIVIWHLSPYPLHRGTVGACALVSKGTI